MKKIILFFLIIITLDCFGQVPPTGNYDELILVRNEAQKSIEGYFSSSIGDGRISCVYKFGGTYKSLSDKIIKVSALWPDSNDKVEGILTCKEKNKFLLKFNEPLPGDMACMGVSQEGTAFELNQLKTWKAIKIARSNKAFFYKETKEITKRKAYILQFDAVGVIEEKGEWLYVDFYGQQLTTGWVKKSDFY